MKYVYICIYGISIYLYFNKYMHFCISFMCCLVKFSLSF